MTEGRPDRAAPAWNVQEAFCELEMAMYGKRGNTFEAQEGQRIEAVLRRCYEAGVADQATSLSALQERASKLEDAAFHFQTCRTCKTAGEESCESGRQFAAFLRGEPDGD